MIGFFVTRILPLVSGSILSFLGGCLGMGVSLVECKYQLLDVYFPYFVRERLIQDLICLIFMVKHSLYVHKSHRFLGCELSSV